MARTHLNGLKNARTPAAPAQASGQLSQRAKARVSTALNHCIEAATDLERFLGHAAVGVRDRATHAGIHDAERTAGDFVVALQRALRSVDAFVENQGTAPGAMRRAAFELDIAFAGRTDERVLASVQTALLRAIGIYDKALDELGQGGGAFRTLVAAQRGVLSAIHRDYAHRSSA